MAGCDCSGVDEALHSIEAARELMLARAEPLAVVEWVALEQAQGRVLAEPLQAAISLPPWDNSAMDGYAINTADLGPDGAHLRISQRIAAGSAGEPLQRGTAARIFTGAPVPAGANAVVMQEVCEARDDAVRIPPSVRLHDNIRDAGEDVRAGDRVLDAGSRLGPAELSLAAALGFAELPVRRRLRVALAATGDELVPPGQPLGPGQIHDSNRFTFLALLRSLGCEVVDLGRISDTLDATCAAFSEGAERADLILTSGGVSVGEEDHVRAAVEQLGELALWRIAMRPGKPLAFGRIGQTHFIGLPGNPVAMFVGFLLFARPFILKLQGADPALPMAQRVRAGFDWPRPDKRREYMRARLTPGADGVPVAEMFHSRSSGSISSLTWGQGLVVVPERQALQLGDWVDYHPFDTLLY